MKFHVADMDCGGCANAITNAIQAEDSKAIVDVDLANKTLDVQSSHSKDSIKAAISGAGYTSKNI